MTDKVITVEKGMTFDEMLAEDRERDEWYRKRDDEEIHWFQTAELEDGYA